MRTLVTLSLLAVTVSAEAASHRLAYSKTENVEVFVDHEDNQPWCSPNLQLRFAFAGKADTDAIERLLPKLGGLLGNQCPGANQLNWSATNSAGARQASGKATQAGGWLAQIDVPAPAPAATASQPEAPTKPATAPTPDARTTTAPVPATAAAATTPEPATQQASPSTDEAPADRTSPPPTPEFTVAGWKPPLERDVLVNADFITEISDQNGCRFRLSFAPEDGIENVSAKSSEVSCDPNGYAQGEGALTLTRRDGVNLRQFKGSFLNGLMISGKAPQLPIAGLDERNNLLLHLYSEPASKVHYLLRLDYNSYNKYWNADSAVLVALTENRELFRDLDSIRRTIDVATAHLDQKAPKMRSVNFYGMRDLEQGLNKGDRDFWLYQIHLSRHYRSGKWQYNPQRAENYLFAFEKKEAEQRRQAELQRQQEEQRQRELLGYQAKQQVALYSQLRQETREPEELYKRILSDARYSPLGGNQYTAMMQGKTSNYSQIVYIDGKADDGWNIEYPYQALLDTAENDLQASEGWFLIKGQARLDTSRQDGKNLPLTVITASSLQQCNEDGCADLRDPLTLMRHELGEPDWTPEHAEDLIKQAWPDRADTQGDDE